VNFFKYTGKNLLFRKTGNILSLILIAVSVAILWAVEEAKKQAESHLAGNLAEIDLVVGAKGSPLQLILSSVFHIDAPTGNISYEEAGNLSRNRMIAAAVPVSMGDNYLGYRIVGTDPEFLSLYKARLASGSMWSREMEVCVGALAAEASGLKTGDTFTGAHGYDRGGDAHGSYVVAGIIEKTGTVLDQLILTPLESVWKAHEGHGHAGEKEVTAVLIRYKMPVAAIQLPRYINENTSMQAAAPAIEINRLYHLLNMGGNTLAYFGFGLLLLAWLSILVSFLKSLEERRFELALLRSYGASAFKVLSFLMAEYVFLAFLGWLSGMAAGRLLLKLIGQSFDYGMAYRFDPFSLGYYDLLLLLLVVVASGVAVLIPSRKIFRISIPDVLSGT
jgi:putative ABC transport system permease protein